jgi:transcriptional regulator
MEQQIEQIKQLQCKKHIKIFKLHQLGIKPKEIADILGANLGNIYRVIKNYNSNPEKSEAINI